MERSLYDYVIILTGNKSTGKTSYLNILNGTYPRRMSPLKRNSSQIIHFQTNIDEKIIKIKFTSDLDEPANLVVIFCAQDDHNSIRALNDKWIPEVFCKEIPITNIFIACTKFDKLPINKVNLANYDMITKFSGLSHFELGNKVFAGFQDLTNEILKKLSNDPNIEFEDIYS